MMDPTIVISACAKSCCFKPNSKISATRPIPKMIHNFVECFIVFSSFEWNPVR